MRGNKLIIEAAINEQSPKEVNPHVPYTPEEIATDALAAARAGAAIVHFHARHPESGALLHPGIEPYREAMRWIRQENADVILYPTYGFSDTAEERFAHLAALAADPDVRLDFATIDPGAVNYGHYDAKEKAWLDDFVMSVSHAEARHFFDFCKGAGVQHSIVVREPGQVRHAAQYQRQGWTSLPLLLKLHFRDASCFGLPPCMEGVHTLISPLVTGGLPVEWMTYVEGESHERMNALAVGGGGHVRTGLGDNAILEGQVMTNAEQVERVAEMATRAGRPLATPADVRALWKPSATDQARSGRSS